MTIHLNLTLSLIRTIWEGIQKLATQRGHTAVFVLGDSHYGPVDVPIAVEQAKTADYVVIVLGEYAYSEMVYPITQLYASFCLVPKESDGIVTRFH
jgi:hypothetical protein